MATATLTSRSSAGRVRIVVDTREQRPWTFSSDRVVTVSRALPAGDYSVAGLEDLVAVERKSLDDLVDTVIHARERFRRELERLGTYDAACVVVEGSMADVAARRYRSKADPNSVMGSVISMALIHRIPTFFCSNRDLAAAFSERYLIRYAREMARIQHEAVIPS